MSAPEATVAAAAPAPEAEPSPVVEAAANNNSDVDTLIRFGDVIKLSTTSSHVAKAASGCIGFLEHKGARVGLIFSGVQR